MFTLAGGAVAVLSESFATHIPEGGARLRVEVFGPRGSLLTDDDGTLTVVSPGGTTRTEEIDRDEGTFAAEIRHFLDCIRTGAESLTAGWGMRPGLAAILAAQASMAVGEAMSNEQ